MAINWRFPPLCGGNEQGYTNSGIETFKGEELIDNLAREICQNSLDAKDVGSDEPVEVKFQLMNIKKGDYDVFSSYSDCITGCKKYWSQEDQEMDEKLNSFILKAEKTLLRDEISVLVASDYNTTGLTGSKAKKKSAWKALTHSDGTSLKNDAGSAGSYGIGKNAPFACSDLSMVFYNTYAKDGIKAFKGVSRLATILDKQDNPTQGVGHYQNNSENEWQPVYEEDSCTFRDLFTRSEYGTDIIIIGFNEKDNWNINVERAIINNFFPAIYEGKLVVHVGGSTIDSTTITSKIKEGFSGDKSIKITEQLFEAMTNWDSRESLSILDENDAELYIKSDVGYGRTIANFRSSGMLVGKYTRRILQHYAAVLIVRGQDLNELLKDTEPPKHNRWDYKLIDQHDNEKRKKAKDCIAKIENSIIEYLKRQYETVSENIIDSDTGEYISDDAEGLGNEAAGDDILRVQQHLGEVRRREKKPTESREVAKKNTGERKEDANVNNEERHPNPMPMPKKPRVVPNEDDDTLGVSLGKGPKIMSSINTIKQKVYPLNSEQGIYKAIVVPGEDCENVFVDFSAVGEDGTSEGLKITSYTYAGKKIKTPTKQIGAISLKKEANNEIVLHFERKEKMVLKMNVYGGGNV